MELCQPLPHFVVVCVQSQWLGAVQLGAGEDLPAGRRNLQMRPGVPTHPPQGNVALLAHSKHSGHAETFHLQQSARRSAYLRFK